jgi:predicted RNA binding protein YcfA (HicA-like mRNA interferase family)
VSPELKHLSGTEIVSIFKTFGFKVHSQRGSHIKLRRLIAGSKQTLTVPNHQEIDTGTLRAIIRQASRFIPENELRPCFYSE